MDRKMIASAMAKAGEYIDRLTVDSPINIPEEVVADERRFFTWDNEHRTPSSEPYLFDWSYYNGVVMEGLYYVAKSDPANGGRYVDYVRRYFDALLVTGEDGLHHISRDLGGYVDHHGADCYKTAALLVLLAGERPDYMEVCRELYRDLTDEAHVNSAGHIIAREYSEKSLGHNYWHTWAKLTPPKYKVWLDGIYMLQPFIARYASMTGDMRQLALVNERLNWAASALRAPNGLYYHAGSSKDDVCPWHWTRSMGWYGMAMVDVMEVLPEKYMAERRAALKAFSDGILKYQRADLFWTNVTDMPATETNRPETSGTAMTVYTILKGVRHGWLDSSYSQPAIRAFTALVDQKLVDGRLTDIYLKASANGSDNYNRPEYYMSDEGKGAGPFIMAYSEMKYL